MSAIRGTAWSRRWRSGSPSVSVRRIGAIFLIPELVGDYRLVPVIAMIVAPAWLLDRGLDRAIGHFGASPDDQVYDADA